MSHEKQEQEPLTAQERKALEEQYAKGAGPVDWRIFLPSFIIILAVAIPLCIDPTMGATMVNKTQAFVTTYFGWAFMWVPIICFIMIFWLTFSHHGDVKLGEPDEQPEFSYFAWISMLFCCGVGSSIIVWGVCEPIYYIDTPPLGIEPRSIEAYQFAQALPIFHWGLSAWAVYAIAALGMAYAIFVRKTPSLRLSSATEGLLSRKQTQGPAGAALEVLVVIGSVGGFGTSLGLGVPFVAEFLASTFNVPNNLLLKGIVILFWTLLFSLSVFKGVAKGMQVLSRINVWLAFVVLAFIFLVGPTLFTLEAFTNSMGVLFNNFFSLSFSVEPFNMQVDGTTHEAVRQAGFPQWWTIFYWCWWVALAPISGIFLGRISRGRTIRQTVWGITFWGGFGCAVTLCVIGSYALHQQYTGAMDIAAMLKQYGTGATAAKVLMSLPLSGVMMWGYIFLAMIFLATTLDAAAFSLASICTRTLKGNEQPPRWHRMLWALALGGFSMGILITGGEGMQSLYTIQTSAVAAGLPLLFALGLMVLALIKNLNASK